MAMTWLESDNRWIPAHHQPALLIDLAAQRGISHHRLLSGTGIFYDELIDGRLLISPLQYGRLIQNADRIFPSREISFLFGHQLFPGHYGPLSTVLLNTGTLHELLVALRRFHLLACPLLYPRLTLTAESCYIRWWPVCGLDAGGYRFMLEAMNTALGSFARFRAGKKQSWRFEFAHARPEWHEQYRVNLGENVAFRTPMDLTVIPREALFNTWHSGATTPYTAAERECRREVEALPAATGFLERVHAHLATRSRRPPSLEETADHFGMSAATFKRKLKKHHASYQLLVDDVRRDLAVFLLRSRGWSSQEVARHMNYTDISNFRRSFKRWTGITPGQLDTV